MNRLGASFYCLEGPIGVGKSTILRGLKDKYGCNVFPEPVEKWKNALHKFYEEETLETAIDLQKLILQTLGERQTSATDPNPEPEMENRTVVVERSLMSGMEIFAELNSKRFPSPRWESVISDYWDACYSLEAGAYRIALHHDNFEELLNRTNRREEDAPELFAETEYLKQVYDACNKFESTCDCVLDVTNLTESETVDQVMAAIDWHMRWKIYG